MTPTDALGGFLRARRGRLQPGQVGLPTGIGLRRTAGLRREELAALAGVSVDYYTRLEQGKETNPSTAVLDALAAALNLDGDAHAHLYALANQAARRIAPTPPRPTRAVSPGLQLLLENLRPAPAYVMNEISDILAANPEGLALFAGLTDWPERRRNTIRYTFLHPAAQSVLADWDRSAAAAVANLRTVAANQPATDTLTRTGLAALVDELCAASDAFESLWQRYDVRPRRSDIKAFHHPAVGRLRLHHEVLRLDDGRRLSVYQANPGTPDSDALTLLSLTTRDQAGDTTDQAGHSS